jgi:hypothetical protein
MAYSGWYRARFSARDGYQVPSLAYLVNPMLRTANVHDALPSITNVKRDRPI